MFAPLPDTWMQWMADNRLRDCSPESMLATMVEGGLDRAASLDALNRLESNPVFLAARKHQQLTRKLESVLANQQKLWETAADYAEVERRKKVPVNEFFERYARGSRPVVLTGLATDWPALKRWTFQALKERFGQLDVEIQAGREADPLYELNNVQHRRMVGLGEFIDLIESGVATNDYYLTADNDLLRRPQFAPLLEDVGAMPGYVDRKRLAAQSHFWMGPKGTITPLHHDTSMRLHTQIMGRKRWRLVSPLETPNLYNYNGMLSPVDVDAPDLVRFPAFAKVKVLDVTLAPGETLFVPLGWWHHVKALDASVSFSWTSLGMANDYGYANPSIKDW